MTIFKTLVVALMAMLLGACATTPPVPVALDTNVPAIVDAGGLRATLRVLDGREVDSFFGNGVGAQFRVMELDVENHGAAVAVSVGLKQIHIVTPSGQQQLAHPPLDVAKMASRIAMNSTGNSVVDAIQLVFGLAALKRAYDLAESWSYLMPETFRVAPGQERRMLLAFLEPDWAAGTWRLELPFAAEQGASSPVLSIPLTFKEVTVK